MESKIYRFQDLIVWKKAHKLTLLIYQLTKNFPKDETYGLVSQMRRCSVSIASNIAEGSKRQTTNDLIHFLNMSEASNEELKYQLILSKDLNYITHQNYEQALSLGNITGALLYRLKQSLKN